MSRYFFLDVSFFDRIFFLLEKSIRRVINFSVQKKKIMFEEYSLSDILATLIVIAFVLLVCTFQVTFHSNSDSNISDDSSTKLITFDNGTKESANKTIITVLPYWEYSWWNFLKID